MESYAYGIIFDTTNISLSLLCRIFYVLFHRHGDCDQKLEKDRNLWPDSSWLKNHTDCCHHRLCSCQPILRITNIELYSTALITKTNPTDYIIHRAMLFDSVHCSVCSLIGKRSRRDRRKKDQKSSKTFRFLSRKVERERERERKK